MSKLILTFPTWAIAVCCLQSLYGCGPLRNLEKNRASSREVSVRHMHLDQETSSQNQAASLHLFRNTDSLNAQYSIRIWPKGTFSYDVVQGFKGEAEKIEIRGRDIQRKTRESLNYKASSKDQRSRTSLDVKQQRSLTTKQQRLKKAVSWKTVLGYLLVAFCLGAGFLLFRGIRKWRLG